MKKLLVDFASSIKLQLTESSSKDGKFLVARGEFGRADVPTQNNRKYPRQIWDREIRRIQEAIQAGKVLGELDHPADGKTSLKRVSHIMTGLHMTEDGVIIGEAKILDNEFGKQLRSILEAGGAVGVSSRGMGSTSPGRDGMEEVQDDYSYITHDFVADPAVITSYPKFQMEVRWLDKPVLTEKGDSAMETVVEQKVEEAKPVTEAQVKVKVETDQPMSDEQLEVAKKELEEIPGVKAVKDGGFNEKKGEHVLKVQTEKPKADDLKEIVAAAVETSKEAPTEEVPAEAPKAEEPKAEEPKEEPKTETAKEEPKAECGEEMEEGKVKAGEEGEIVKSLDDTCTIWKNADGYYWYDKHLAQMSTNFFETEADAEKDAEESGVLDKIEESNINEASGDRKISVTAFWSPDSGSGVSDDVLLDIKEVGKMSNLEGTVKKFRNKLDKLGYEILNAFKPGLYDTEYVQYTAKAKNKEGDPGLVDILVRDESEQSYFGHEVTDRLPKFESIEEAKKVKVKKGQKVVTKNHGPAKITGIEKVTLGGKEHEMVTMQADNGLTIKVPSKELNKVLESVDLPAFEAVFESIKALVKPFVTEDEKLSQIQESKEKVEVLEARLEEESLKTKLAEKKLQEAAQIVERLSAKIFILESLDKELVEDKSLITSFLGDITQFLVVEDADKAYKSAKEKAESKKKEMKEAEEKIQAKLTESAERNKKLETALKESTELNKKLGLQLYIDKRIAGNSNAVEIKKLCEGKTNKEEIDAIIERYIVAEGNSSEYNAIRNRLSQLPKTLVEDHLKDTEPKKRGLVEESVEGEMANLFGSTIEQVERSI